MTRIAPDVSVAICAYTEERWDDLSAAVDSVQQQVVAPSEVIVVVDHNPRLSQKARSLMPDVVVVDNQEQRGANGARNAAMAAAKGAIVAFLDDDAVAAPDWLELLLAGFRDPRVVGIGGLAAPLWHGGDGPPRWFPEEFNWVVGCSYRGMPQTNTEVRNVFSCNMAIRREVWTAIGGFRHGIGHVGGQPRGDDETEFCIRVRQRWPQRALLYEPRAKVYHHVPLRRTTWRYFCSRCWLEGRSKALLVRFAGSRDALSTERAYARQALPKAVMRGLVDATLRGHVVGLARAAAVVVGLTTTTAGFLVGRAMRSQEVRRAQPNDSRALMDQALRSGA